MPGVGLRVYPSPEISTELIFNSDTLKVLGSEIKSVTARLQREGASGGLSGGLSITEKWLGSKNPKERLLLILEGVDTEAMANAYTSLRRLMLGDLVTVQPPDRPKLFPPRKAERDIVQMELRKIAQTTHCLIRPLFATSVIRIVGPTAKATGDAAQAVERYMAAKPFQTQLRIHGRFKKAIQQKVKDMLGSSAQVEDLTLSFDPNGLLVRSCNQSIFDMALSDVKDHLAVLAGGEQPGSECCVCFDTVDMPLGTCGHAPMCKLCSAQSICSETQENAFPLKCAECRTPLLSEDLTCLAQDLDSVYEASVGTFVLGHTAAFGFCATPDCGQILDRTLEETMCAVCLRVQCPRCGAGPHTSETCEEAAARLTFEQSPEGRMARLVQLTRDKFLSPWCLSCGAAFLDFSGCFGTHTHTHTHASL